tara:strand:- start:39677 stop:40525 length:849 start_codon:yes stop_codon:yes gene_type:complete
MEIRFSRSNPALQFIVGKVKEYRALYANEDWHGAKPMRVGAFSIKTAQHQGIKFASNRRNVHFAANSAQHRLLKCVMRSRKIPEHAMNNEPDLHSEDSPEQPGSLSRRSALKRAAGAGIIMSSLASGSALASISCQKYSNWMSGKLNSGSPGRPDTFTCALGRSPGFWGNSVKANGTCSRSLNNNFSGMCDAVKAVFNSAFASVFAGGSSQTFGHILNNEGRNFGSGINVDRAFCAAYFNARFFTGYPLTTADLTVLFSKIGTPGFDGEDIKDYLESTYEAG